MGLNKAIGNMYAFLNNYPFRGANRGYTINFAKGICPFVCTYCYYQNNPRYKNKIGELRLDIKEFKTNLGKSNFIFAGSSTDMFMAPKPWIIKILNYCCQFDNQYLFQTKNPEKFQEFFHLFPPKSILGTTIESNYNYKYSKAPLPVFRKDWMTKVPFPRMVSIEPIMDFDLNMMVDWIKEINPIFVSIGADSKKHNLPEPPKEKIISFIIQLRRFTKVILKDNLKRLTIKNGT